MNIVRCPYAPKGGSKTQNGRFPGQNRISLEESLLQSFCLCKLLATKLFGLTIHAKIIGGGDPFYLKF